MIFFYGGGSPKVKLKILGYCLQWCAQEISMGGDIFYKFFGKSTFKLIMVIQIQKLLNIICSFMHNEYHSTLELIYDY